MTLLDFVFYCVLLCVAWVSLSAALCLSLVQKGWRTVGDFQKWVIRLGGRSNVHCWLCLGLNDGATEQVFQGNFIID